MSAEAMGWVYRYSPLKGVGFAVHLAIADSANDQHDMRFWMRQRTLGVKARTSRETAGKALADLVELDLLELLEQGKGRGAPNEYRLLLPDGLEVVYDTRGGVTVDRTPGATVDHTGCDLTSHRGVTTAHTHIKPKEEPKEEPNTSVAALEQEFDEQFWPAYDARRRIGKGDARRRWVKARKAGVPADEILAGLASVSVLWATWPADRAQFIPHPATWINQRRWEDEVPTGERARADGPSAEVEL